MLKVGRKLKDAQMGAISSDSPKAISEWQPLAVFEKRIEDYNGDTSPDVLKQCFNEALNAVLEEDI